MYFNKTRCFVAFGLFLVDLQLPGSLTLTPGTAPDAEPVLVSLQEDKGGYLFTHRHMRGFAVCQSMFWQICSICWSFILSVVFFFFFFSFSLLSLFPSINVKKGKQTSAKSTHILFCMSVHYIILSSLQAPMPPLLWTTTVVDFPRVFGELRGSECQ